MAPSSKPSPPRSASGQPSAGSPAPPHARPAQARPVWVMDLAAPRREPADAPSAPIDDGQAHADKRPLPLVAHGRRAADFADLWAKADTAVGRARRKLVSKVLVWTAIGAAIQAGVGVIVSSGRRISPATWLLLAFPAVMLMGAAWFESRRPFAQARRKRAFLDELVTALLQDTYPGSRLQVRADLAPTEANAKRWSVTRNARGKPKERFRDEWLDVRGFLADGSRFRVRRRADMKVKYRRMVLRYRRRALVELWPNPRRYDVRRAADNPARLARCVRRAVEAGFHDPPEGLKAAPGGPSKSPFAVRVVQLDADILASEIVLVLAAMVDYLQVFPARPEA